MAPAEQEARWGAVPPGRRHPVQPALQQQLGAAHIPFRKHPQMASAKLSLRATVLMTPQWRCRVPCVDQTPRASVSLLPFTS